MRRTSFALVVFSLAPAAAAADPAVTAGFAPTSGDAGYHPYAKRHGVRVIDLSARARAAAPERYLASPTAQPDMQQLNRVMRGELPADPDGDQPRTGLPEGWVQRGGMVLPAEIDDGSIVVEPETIFAVEDIPGNAYPRKHTLFLNFNGGMLSSGGDNSAENVSQLARNGVYPAWTQGEPKAIAIAQAVQADFAPFGVTVVYESRPEKVLPYTMQMMGGDWQDTNIDSPAGGVAPGADCGALGQRHVVYTFDSASTVQMANTASQEAGHAYGLDHTLDCNSVMSYCGGGDGSFREGCAGLCEAACQGPNSAGCQLTHEMFCGEGSFEQNDFDEMTWLFGTNEPDMEAPTAEIVSPTDGDTFDVGASVDFRALVADNYGGFGWLVRVEKDGEVILDEPRYDREVDEEYRAALNFSGLESGTYTVTIEVHDHFGQVGSDTISFVVGTPGETGPADTSGGTTDPGDTSDGAESAGESSSGGGTGGVGATGDDGGAPKGCECAAGPGPAPGVLGLAWLAILGLRPRRRGR
jgi:MYXO-CTERM domain-containing protein